MPIQRSKTTNETERKRAVSRIMGIYLYLRPLFGDRLNLNFNKIDKEFCAALLNEDPQQPPEPDEFLRILDTPGHMEVRILLPIWLYIWAFQIIALYVVFVLPR